VIPPGHFLYDVIVHAFERRVLWPLAWFGVLETRPVPGVHGPAHQQYRVTPLYDELLRIAVSPPRDMPRAS
jgi:hypothetical protein